MPNVTRLKLAHALHKKIGLSISESASFVDSFLDITAQALISGDDVSLSGFGSFRVQSKKERIGRNPKTGQLWPIEARKVITFKPSHIFMDLVNEE